MSEQFVPRFRQMVDDLHKNRRIHLIDYEIAPPVSAAEIEAANRAVRGGLPSEMKSFYLEMNGFSLEWAHTLDSARRGDDRDTGAVEILPLAEVLKDWHGIIWFDDGGADRFKDLKPFDFFVAEACAGLQYSEEKGIAPTVRYHYLGEFVYDTGYIFSEFIDRLLAARGSWYWIETLCQETCDGPQAKDFFERMPLLFEDFQASLFRPGPLAAKSGK